MSKNIVQTVKNSLNEQKKNGAYVYTWIYIDHVAAAPSPLACPSHGARPPSLF